MSNDFEIFNAVADALIKVDASDRIKHDVLAATMDKVGVPFMSFERYIEDPAIVALFNERGVRVMTDEEKAATLRME